MSYSKTSICNMALGHVGSGTLLSNVETDNSPEARECRRFYDICVDVLLEMQEWPFAKEQADLQDLGSPPDEWGYRYKVPARCVLPLRIVNPAKRTPGTDEQIPYKIANRDDGDGRVILTDQENAILEFNAPITETQRFSGMFVYALSWFLADNISMPLRVSADIAKYCRDTWRAWQSEANIQARREEQPDPYPQSEFVTVRG